MATEPPSHRTTGQAMATAPPQDHRAGYGYCPSPHRTTGQAMATAPFLSR